MKFCCSLGCFQLTLKWRRGFTASTLFHPYQADAMNWNKGGPGTKRGFGFGGFSISSGKKEEPKLSQQSHSAFGATGSAAGFGKSPPPQLPSFYKIGSKRANFDEENA